MNILLAHFKIQDWGGIVNYSDCLAKGFKALGHNVDSAMLKNKGATGIPKIKNREGQQGWEFGTGLGLWMHQKSGWEGMYELNYCTDLLEWQSETSQYDLIIYVVPVPTCTKQNKGDDQWLKVFDNDWSRQIAIVHDGNMQTLYPHIVNICDKIDGVVCVHDAAFNSCDVLPICRAFIPNPHDIPSNLSVLPAEDRREGFVSLQTFKRWKRVDDLIRAIPHMYEPHGKVICGGGIEYHYMTSLDKCKPEYMDEYGDAIWDNALDNGMDWEGYVTTHKRDFLLSNYRILIDPSWSKNYSKLGCHFNRVMVEAMCHGCVPMCTDLAMKGSLLFKPDVNYIEIPWNIDPEGYAKLVDNSINDIDKLNRIRQNNMKLCQMFDKKSIAEAIIEFVDGEGCIGKPTDKFLKAASRKMEHFDEFNT